MSARKAPASLDAGLVAKKGAATPTPGIPGRAAPLPDASPVSIPSAVIPRSVPLNFKISPDLDRRFRVFAAERRMKLSDLLEKAFDAYEKANR